MFNYLSVLGKAHTIFIFFGEYGVFQRPGDVQFRIVPAQAGFHFGVIVFRTLVMEMGKLAENGKAVRKTGGDPELVLVVRRELASVPLAEGGRSRTDIHGHVKDIAEGNADQLALCECLLIVQAAQYPAP